MSADSQRLSLSEWFDTSELEPCPDCGARELLPESPHAVIRLCLNCGVVPKPARTAVGRAALDDQGRTVPANRAMSER
jgi:hypothetical protein